MRGGNGGQKEGREGGRAGGKAGEWRGELERGREYIKEEKIRTLLSTNNNSMPRDENCN